MKRMRSWWLAAAACAVLAAALLLPQRFLQQKLDRVAETEFSVDGAELDMEEAVTLMERLRLAAVGEFIAQNTGDDAGALTAQTQQWLLDAQSVIPQPIRPYIDLSGEVLRKADGSLTRPRARYFRRSVRRCTIRRLLTRSFCSMRRPAGCSIWRCCSIRSLII